MAETTLRDTLRLAEDDIGAGRPADGLTRCHHILTHYPQMLEAQRVLGEAYLALRKTKEAFKAFDRVLVSDPENTLAYCGRALISQQLNDYESALDCYYQACELSLGNRQLRQEFRRLATQANQPDFILSRVGLARLYMRGDLLAHAIREWEQVLAGDPERADARLGLAEALWRAGQAVRSAEQCRLILQAIPSCLKALLLLGEVSYRAGKLDEADQYLEQARSLDPDGRLARELFADALISDKAFGDFILAEPARIQAMEDQASAASETAAPTAPSPKVDTQALASQAAGTADEESQFFTDEPFSFSFLDDSTSGSGSPLREGESLEEMLAALIEHPASLEAPPSAKRARTQAPEIQPIDRFQALLSGFSNPEESAAVIPASTAPLREPDQERPISAPPTPKNPEAATANFSEALFWLDTNNRQTDISPAPSPEKTTPNRMARSPNADTGSPLLRSEGAAEWADEEDTEAGWLRWLQAQGARSLDEATELEEVEPFAALLHPADQPPAPRATLWEAPTPEFVRSFWPNDTVPQSAVRLTPGSGARLSAATPDQALENGELTANAPDDTAAGLTAISSVSLRPLTLEELEGAFSASGLTRIEGSLAALRGDSSLESWGHDLTDGPVFTIAEDDYPGRLELAERQRKTGRIDEALGHYRAIIRGAPGLLDKVILGLQAAASQSPEQAAIYRILGDAYTRRGNYMEALEAYNRGLAASRGHSFQPGGR